MQKRFLGNSDLEITPIGLGAWAIGGAGWSYGWGSQDDKDSIAAIEKAVDAGINWIDTAAVYGLGHSEKVVAQALKNIGPANRPYVFTKCSLVWDEDKNITHSLNPDSIRREVEDSLRRLDGETIDLYQIHWASFGENGDDSGVEEAWETLVDLKQQGKVRHIGVSNFTVPQMERAQKIAPITSLQPPYSMLRPGIEDEILPYAKKNNIGVITYATMECGLLTGKMTRERLQNMGDDDWRKKAARFNEPELTKNLELAAKLGEIGARHGLTAGAVAIAWALRRDEVTAAIVGMRNPGQVEGVIGAGTFRLSDEELAEIDTKR